MKKKHPTESTPQHRSSGASMVKQVLLGIAPFAGALRSTRKYYSIVLNPGVSAEKHAIMVKDVLYVFIPSPCESLVAVYMTCYTELPHVFLKST